MLLKKVDDLQDALFRNDKMRQLACLMIEDEPDDDQLNYIMSSENDRVGGMNGEDGIKRGRGLKVK